MRVLIVFVLSLLPTSAFAQDDPPPLHASSAITSFSRYEMIQSHLAARWLFRLDRQTGEVSQIVQDKEENLKWQKMEVKDLPPAQKSGVHYQLFISGFAAKFSFLMNVDDGRTWQLEKETDPVTKEDAEVWVPIN